MANEKETFYFTHDYSARNDPKMSKLRIKLGMAGIGTYWVLIEYCYEQGGILLIEDIDMIADTLRCDSEMLKSVIYDFGLFDSNGSEFYSKSVLSRLDKRQEKSNKAKIAVKKRWENANKNTDVQEKDTDVIQTQSDSNTIKESKEKESKEKESKEREVFTRDTVFENEILKFFGFNEIRNFDKLKQIGHACNMLHFNNQLENFKKQFSAYKEWLSVVGMKFRVNLDKYLGKMDESFMDGYWNSQNWEEKLSLEKSGKPKTEPVEVIIPELPDDILYNSLTPDKRKLASKKWMAQGHWYKSDGYKKEQGWYLNTGEKVTITQ